MLTQKGWQSNIINGIKFYHLGQAYLDQLQIDIHRFASELAACKTPDQLTGVLPPLNGFYAWMEQSADQVRAAVDHIRSRPLFYGLANGQFYLSDDAEWVRRQVGDREMDPVAREEFQLAGYVTGADTLFPHVKQLQAGEFLIARQTEAGPVVETYRYYRFLHKEPLNSSEPVLRAELDRVTVRVMQRLIDYANGRQIVIPLSGGYDSRLIATMLKRLGYGNLMGFSYGVAGNPEAACSEQVATSLGIPWRFVEYTNEGLARTWSTTQARAYRAMAANHASLPHVQDWFAIKQLTEQGQIQSDAILVPGHSGDFVAGSHIPPFVFGRKKFSLAELIQHLINAHMSNAPGYRHGITKDGTLERRLMDRINHDFDGADISMANLIEVWDWQERQSKYIVNSVRVYDQFNLEWWLPLWDIEFVRFWEGVPLELRKGREWFIDWIDEQYEAISGRPLVSNTDTAPKQRPPFRNHLKKITRKILPQLIVDHSRLIKWRLISDKNYQIHQRHFLAFAGLVPRHKLKNYLAQGFNIIGIFSDLYIKDEWDNITGW